MVMELNTVENKKVLLRERKRHTARRVVSTPPPPPRPDLAGEVPYLGTPLGRVPPAGYSWQGNPPGRIPPPWTWQGTPTPPPGRVPPPAGPGRVPHPRCPMAFWVMLQSIMGYGYPPVDRQMEGQTRVKTLPSRRTTYAGGKNKSLFVKGLHLVTAHKSNVIEVYTVTRKCPVMELHTVHIIAEQQCDFL